MKKSILTNQLEKENETECINELKNSLIGLWIESMNANALTAYNLNDLRNEFVLLNNIENEISLLILILKNEQLKTVHLSNVLDECLRICLEEKLGNNLLFSCSKFIKAMNILEENNLIDTAFHYFHRLMTSGKVFDAQTVNDLFVCHLRLEIITDNYEISQIKQNLTEKWNELSEKAKLTIQYIICQQSDLAMKRCEWEKGKEWNFILTEIIIKPFNETDLNNFYICKRRMCECEIKMGEFQKAEIIAKRLMIEDKGSAITVYWFILTLIKLKKKTELSDLLKIMENGKGFEVNLMYSLLQESEGDIKIQFVILKELIEELNENNIENYQRILFIFSNLSENVLTEMFDEGGDWQSLINYLKKVCQIFVMNETVSNNNSESILSFHQMSWNFGINSANLQLFDISADFFKLSFIFSQLLEHSTETAVLSGFFAVTSHVNYLRENVQLSVESDFLEILKETLKISKDLKLNNILIVSNLELLCRLQDWFEIKESFKDLPVSVKLTACLTLLNSHHSILNDLSIQTLCDCVEMTISEEINELTVNYEKIEEIMELILQILFASNSNKSLSIIRAFLKYTILSLAKFSDSFITFILINSWNQTVLLFSTNNMILSKQWSDLCLLLLKFIPTEDYLHLRMKITELSKQLN